MASSLWGEFLMRKGLHVSSPNPTANPVSVYKGTDYYSFPQNQTLQVSIFNVKNQQPVSLTETFYFFGIKLLKVRRE